MIGIIKYCTFPLTKLEIKIEITDKTVGHQNKNKGVMHSKNLIVTLHYGK
jgi:hypothetical protein